MSILNSMDLDIAGIKVEQELEVLVWQTWHDRPEVPNMALCKSKACNKVHDLIYSGEYSKLALEGCLAEECLKDSVVILAAISPVSVTHSYLIVVSQQRIHPIELYSLLFFFLVSNHLLFILL